MTVVNPQMSPGQIVTFIQTRLSTLRSALNAVNDLYGWTSEIEASDLAALTPWTVDDATTVLKAVEDAYALLQLATTGLPPDGYPQPTVNGVVTAYVYASTIRQAIGPQ